MDYHFHLLVIMRPEDEVPDEEVQKRFQQLQIVNTFPVR